MQEIHSRATMLAREASSREEELVAMKVVELKVQGGAGQACRGRGPLGQYKAWLRRRLHAAIVSEYLESVAGAAGE